MLDDEELLLALLNSTPTVKGTRTDGLEGSAGRAVARRFGGTGSPAQLRHLRRVRAALQRTVREGISSDDDLEPLLGNAVLAPEVTRGGIHWELRTDPDEELGVRAILAWSDVLSQLPGRLRACANAECTLFLIDHSRPGTARWCSMTTCGNRMKARAHASRHRERGGHAASAGDAHPGTPRAPSR